MLYAKIGVQTVADLSVVAQVHVQRTRRTRPRSRHHGGPDRYTASHRVRQRSWITSAGEWQHVKKNVRQFPRNNLNKNEKIVK